MPDCAVSLSDPQVSRHHAEVRPDRTGYRVVDLGSMNGTLVNGTRITEHPLQDGDVILVGATSVRYEES
jgi:pSer/pThr/pTyr-binding forkhead associated (FHA) protein